jgi:hypothetical protein
MYVGFAFRGIHAFTSGRVNHRVKRGIKACNSPARKVDMPEFGI